MLCTEEMGTLLSRYVDGELAEKERKSIETHLETCASCRDVLNLFQRNDNVLNNALVGEAFGAQTVDAVMTEIRRLEEPMVVAPAVEEEPAPAPVAMRQTMIETQASARIATQAISDRARELSQELRDAEVRANLRWAKESTGLAYVNDRAIVVQANFPTEKFYPFQVFRAKEVGSRGFEPWSTLRTDLPTPYFKDTMVEPGVNYIYQ